MPTAKLKVGLLLNSTELDAWAFRLLEILKASDYAEISLVILNTVPAEKLRIRLARNLRPRALAAGVARRVVGATERLVVGRGVLPNAFRRVDASNLLADVEAIRVTPRRTRYSDFIEGDDLAQIEARRLDVIVRLGFRILRGGILRSARHGVWSFHHGDNHVNRGGPAGYWEVMQSWPTTGAVLQVLTEDLDNGRVLCRSVFSTWDMSILDNKSNCYWKTLHFLPRKLKELHEQGPERFFAAIGAAKSPLHLYDRPIYRRPANGERAALLARKVLQRLKRRWYRARYFDQWCLLYDLRDDMSTALWRFKPIVPPKDRMWADPFVVARDGRFFIFMEEMRYAENKGHIAVLEMDAQGRMKDPVTVLEQPYHLSYPFIFDFEGALYMLPESSSNGTLGVYKCTRFPDRWEFQRNLMQGPRVADATLFQSGERWWMFANVTHAAEAPNWDELFVYYSDSPLSDRWTAHPLNPVVSDVRSARPAGRLFRHAGKLYRPSQNSAGHYGYGFNLCEVTKLSETQYEEHVASAVEPKWDPSIVSTHTFNHERGLTIVDCQLRRSRWW